MIRWFTVNGIAANLMMFAILAGGLYTAAYRIPLEVDPKVSWDTVVVHMPYRGATARDVERAVLIPIEEALEGVQGIKELHAEGYRGAGRLYLNAEPNTDMRALMDDVKSRVDQITTFPGETERPRVYLGESHDEVLSIAVTGNLDEHGLRKVTRRVLDDILELPGVSRAEMDGIRNYEISIEASAEKLVAYDLSFQDLADAVRRFSIDLPAGSIDSESGMFVVRTLGQAYSEQDFASIPIRSTDGATLLLGDVAEIEDGFEGTERQVIFNGKPAMFIEVMRVGNESAIDISDKIHEYVLGSNARFPDGIELFVWDDESRAIRGRLGTLIGSLLQGGVLVMIVLGLFLRPSLAFWIVLGIPVAFAGGVILMPWFGVTANVMSLFGFIIVVGIVVDDAIVTGENIFTKLNSGVPPLEAAVEGTHEVATPVTFGAITTMVAFIPLLYFEGRWGAFARQIPPVVTAVLLFSLIESKLILPAHLKHLRVSRRSNFFTRFQTSIANGMERFIHGVYEPSLRVAVQHRASVIATFIAMALTMAGYCIGGRMEFVSFPTVDRERISAFLELPSDTPLETTARYVDRMEDALNQVRKEFVDPETGESLIRHVSRFTGASRWNRGSSSTGYISVEVMPPDDRSEPGPKNSEIAARWTEIMGPIPEARRFNVRSESSFRERQNYEDDELNIELRGPDSPEKLEVAQKIRDMLEGYAGIASAWADVDYGQDELEISMKPQGAELGLTQTLLAQQIRQAFYGEEAQRVQRGIDDIRVMVRLPRKDRETLHTFDQFKVRTPRGIEVPLMTVADVRFTKTPADVYRHDKAEITWIGAQPVDESVDMIGIANEITPRLDAWCREAHLSYKFQGYVADAEEAKRRTIMGGIALFLALYALLSMALKSILQPFYIMLSVPFGIIGALLGHVIMDMTPSYLSIFGMLALAGIAVNDALVMVDFINRRGREGATLKEAALEAGARRFRPIMLTSVTTFVGLLPLMMDRSLQAQFLIPMAVSLAFGVLFATIITLYLLPCSLLLADDVGRGLARVRNWYLRPFRTADSG